EELHAQFPKWKVIEYLTHEERYDDKTPANLAMSYWKDTAAGRIDIPNFPGQWMAIETVAKPSRGSKYDKTRYIETPFARKIGLRGDRFEKSWNTVNNAIEQHKGEVLREAGFPEGTADIRMLEALEYNLIANRKVWEYSHYSAE